MKLPNEVRTALNATGLPWAIEEGRKHRQIRINGRLAGLLPHGTSIGSLNCMHNLISQIRRKAREIK